MAFRDFSILPTRPGQKNKLVHEQVFARLNRAAQLNETELFNEYKTRLNGLNAQEVQDLREVFGYNHIVTEQHITFLKRLWENVRNPLVILLVVLGIVSYFTGDLRAATVIGAMVLIGIVLRFVQESRADQAAEKLQAMVSTTATVVREGALQEVTLEEIVPGDIVQLSAGDMVPADVRILSAKDLFINQAVLTGESYPVEKMAGANAASDQSPLERTNLCFLGTNVESGSGRAVVLATGAGTYFGSLATRMTSERPPTSFDIGINQFTWLMISLMGVLVPLVFLINGIGKHNWVEALLFALAVAVGLTPEMLPMIVTVNLSKGALSMASKKVVVKRLNAIQNFGAMDVLCTDKTGTLTEGKIVLEKHMDVSGNENDEILDLAYLNSFHQTGLRNLTDVAILDHATMRGRQEKVTGFTKVDEVPFDFHRKRMSVIVQTPTGEHLLITKGAVEETLSVCSLVEVKGEVLPRVGKYDQKRQQMIEALNREGYRVIGLAYKVLSEAECKDGYTVEDESNMTLKGFLAFLDPPKESAAAAIAQLHHYKVEVKILTGDNDLVSESICKQVGLPTEHILLGPEIDALSDEQLSREAERVNIFARLSPDHKERIILALKRAGHVVGFMGDGINDAPALRSADVGISVNSAVDIAKESSEIILLENSLLVLEEGVIEGRRVFGNIIKYIKMAASSSFGNMFSMLGASILLPFVPMLPIQILINNLLYDFSQIAIPSDTVDSEWIEKPRKWAIGELRKFILFIGPISSIFDYVTFFVMIYVFNSWTNPTLFHTGWFIESLFTQTLIIHVIRTNKIPFIQSRASLPLLLTSLGIVLFGAFLPYSPLANTLGLTPLPLLYWAILLGILLGYAVLTQVVKTWFNRKYAAQE